jgi:quercetin dioxygenase-like cupin family protein
MTVSKDARYTIEDRRLIAETPDLRAQILALASAEEVPWHYHTAVTDAFVRFEGPMVVQTRSADGKHEPQAGDSCSVSPNTPHQVAGRNGGRCRFVIVQEVGPYDYIPVED